MREMQTQDTQKTPRGLPGLKSIRLRKGFGQEELAVRANTRLTTIWRLENAQVNASQDMIERLRGALDCSYDDLFREPAEKAS